MGENSKIEWSDIKGFPGYRVSSTGDVQSFWKRVGMGRGIAPRFEISTEGRTLKRSICKGYACVNLGRRNKKRICRLVLEAFIGPCPDGLECCHKDGDSLNDALRNLRWGTSASNTNDQRLAGTLVGGERHGNSKLTNADVEILRHIAPGYKQSELASMFGVKQGTISVILAGKSRTESSHSGRGL